MLYRRLTLSIILRQLVLISGQSVYPAAKLNVAAKQFRTKSFSLAGFKARSVTKRIGSRWSQTTRNPNSKNVLGYLLVSQEKTSLKEWLSEVDQIIWFNQTWLKHDR
jgi:hypothetical protein